MSSRLIKKIHRGILVVMVVTVFLAVFTFVKVLMSSNVILFLSHLVFSLIVFLFYIFYGWNYFISDYVFDKCHVIEYENFLRSKKNKKTSVKMLLEKLDFITGNNSDVDEELTLFIETEKNVLSASNTESIYKNVFDKLRSSDNSFIKSYTEVLEFIKDKKYEEALDKLDRISDINNLFDIPRSFYTAYVLFEMGKCDDEAQNHILFLVNRGRESRYYVLAKQFFKLDDVNSKVASSREKLVIPKYWIAFMAYLIWVALVFIFV